MIGPFTITHDANGNQITTLTTGTNSESQYLYDEETRLACANSGKQTPTPSCSGSGMIDFIYDHAGVRKIKKAANVTIYPNQYFTDFGGGTARMDAAEQGQRRKLYRQHDLGDRRGFEIGKPGGRGVGTGAPVLKVRAELYYVHSLDSP